MLALVQLLVKELYWIMKEEVCAHLTARLKYT